MAQPQQWKEILGWGDQEINDLRSIAFSYIRQGIYDVALTFFDGLGVLTKLTAHDLQTLGALHLQIGNGLKALDYLDRAIKLDPNHLPTRLNQVKALFMLGYKKQGLAQATALKNVQDPMISSQAMALVLSYQ